VTVTLSLAYLAVLTHQRNRQSQADILRAQSHVLTDLSRSGTSPIKGAAATAAQQHPGFAETAKRRWNSELEGAVRWAQTTDWNRMRESAEGSVARLLWGAEPEGERRVESVERAVRGEAEATGRTVREAVESVGREARGAIEKTRTRSAGAADAVHVKAEEAKAAMARGVEKGKEMVGKAKATIGLAEERLETKADAKLFGVSEVERALNQRYEKSDVMSKSVAEVLSERYTPIDKGDNAKLRGI